MSLVVCTRNRRNSLKVTLESITRAADVSGFRIEVVVVDNGSTDDTSDVVRTWASQQSFAVTSILKDEPGLSRARNAALSVVRAPIIAMSDDDCVLHSDYLLCLRSAFDVERGPVIIGGRIELGDPRDLPITVKTKSSALTLNPESFPAGFVMGANLAFTSDVPALVGKFDERFGAGARFVAAEDTDFLLRSTRLGIPVRYDPSFAVDHFHGRRQKEEAVALSRGYNFGDGALYAKHLRSDPRILKAIKSDLKFAIREIWQPGTADPGIRRFAQFKLRHRIRGFLAYHRGAATERPSKW